MSGEIPGLSELSSMLMPQTAIVLTQSQVAEREARAVEQQVQRLIQVLETADEGSQELENALEEVADIFGHLKSWDDIKSAVGSVKSSIIAGTNSYKK